MYLLLSPLFFALDHRIYLTQQEQVFMLNQFLVVKRLEVASNCYKYKCASNITLSCVVGFFLCYRMSKSGLLQEVINQTNTRLVCK